jgi:hypothetical protein
MTVLSPLYSGKTGSLLDPGSRVDPGSKVDRAEQLLSLQVTRVARTRMRSRRRPGNSSNSNNSYNYPRPQLTSKTFLKNFEVQPNLRSKLLENFKFDKFPGLQEPHTRIKLYSNINIIYIRCILYSTV